MLLNEEQLKEYGRGLGAGLGPGDVVALTGELGAGKTTLAKAIAAGLGVTEPVTSPTFTLAGEYLSGRLPFYHIDVYRLGKPGEKVAEAELSEIGYGEYFYGAGVTVIEWADRVEGLLPERSLWIALSYTDDVAMRCVEPTGGAAPIAPPITGTDLLIEPDLGAAIAPGVERPQIVPTGGGSLVVPGRERPQIVPTGGGSLVAPGVERPQIGAGRPQISVRGGGLLAIETTGPVCSAALMTADGRTLYRASAEGLMHLTSLLPMVRELMEEAGLRPRQIGRVVVSAGPGSFTGIRIGVATARALAQALRIPVVKVPTLETFVYNAGADRPYTSVRGPASASASSSSSSFVYNAGAGRPYTVACPIFDARREQMYAGAYMLEEDGRIMTLVKGGAYDPDVFFASLEASVTALATLAEHASGKDAVVSCKLMGDGLPVFKEAIGKFLGFAAAHGIDASADPAVQDARATLAWAIKQGGPEEYESIEPIYYRKAEAQRRLDERNAATGEGAGDPDCGSSRTDEGGGSWLCGGGAGESGCGSSRTDEGGGSFRSNEGGKRKYGGSGPDSLHKICAGGGGGGSFCTGGISGSESDSLHKICAGGPGFDYSTRPAEEADVYGISVIERLSFGEPWLEQSILSDLKLEYSDYVVCENEGHILGYAGLHRILDEGHITNIAVLPGARRSGVGSSALRELLARAEARGIGDFTLEVRESDMAARHFYEKFGFAYEGIRRDYYPRAGGGREDALIMWRRPAEGRL